MSKMRKITIAAVVVVLLASLFATGQAVASPEPTQEGVLGLHVIQPGEHLYSIARCYEVDPVAIARASGLFSVNQVLQPGWVLTIPNAPMTHVAGPTAVAQFGALESAAESVPVDPQPSAAEQGSSSGGLSPSWPANIQQWKVLIEFHAVAYGLGPDLVAAIMTVESAGRVSAVSVSNAQSLMQVMPQEAGYPGRPTMLQLMDPSTNIEWGCKILRAGIDAGGGPWGLMGGVARYYGVGKQMTAWYVEKVYSVYMAHNQ